MKSKFTFFSIVAEPCQDTLPEGWNDEAEWSEFNIGLNMREDILEMISQMITTMGKCGDRNCEVMAKNYECEFPMDVMSFDVFKLMMNNHKDTVHSNIFPIYEDCLQNSTVLLVKDFCKKSCNICSMFYQFLL